MGVDTCDSDRDLEVPLLDLKPTHERILPQLRQAALGVIESNRFIGGPEVEGFEAEAARYLGVSHTVGVSSGTDALIVSMMALGVSPGDEVIVPSFTFFATAGSVHRLGAVPVFCDVLDSSFNMDPDQVERLITTRTKAVVVVHLFGQAADMDRIGELCRSRGIAVIEDAAQAIGAEFNGQRVGAIGDAGCFSFFPSKNLGGIGDGGLVSTNDADLTHKIRILRDHGATRRYYHAVVGGNFRLDAIQAAILRVKLKGLEQWHQERRANAAAYAEGLQGLDDKGLIRLPRELPSRRHVYNQYVIRVKQRDALQEYLAARRIGTAIYYPVPLHRQECFQDAGRVAPRLPRSEQAAQEVLALPVFPGLTVPQRDKVIRCVSEFLVQHGREDRV